MLSNLQFVTIQKATHTLGYNPTAVLPEEYADWSCRFSPVRTVILPEFQIAANTVSVEALLAGEQDAFDECLELSDVVALLNRVLLPYGLVVPTEDELEASLGAHLFPWGAEEVPTGSPYPAREPAMGLMPSGLTLDGDCYNVEVVKTALKLGDGGESICGGHPLLAWLSLSRAHRLGGEHMEACLFEHLEQASVRPVRILENVTF